MEFTVSRNSLLQALQHTRCAISPKGCSYDPYKSFVFTFGEDEQKMVMTIHASDGELWMTERVMLDEDPVEPRSIALWYSDLLRAIKSLDEQPLRFEVGESQMTVHHSVGSFRLPLENCANEFLEIPRPCPEAEAEDCSILNFEAPALRSVLGRCCFAMAQDELRPVMNGVYVNLTSNFSDFVSSDGHKLVRVRKRSLYGSKYLVSCGNETEMSLILPSRIVRTLLKVLPSTGDIEIQYQEELTKTKKTRDSQRRVTTHEIQERKAQCLIVIDDTLTLAFNPVEGKYPRYWTVIPDSWNIQMSVDRKALIKSCDRLSLFANESSGLMLLDLDRNTLRLKTEDADFSLAGDEQLPCFTEYHDRRSPVSLRIGMKCPSLSQTLKALSSEKVCMHLVDSSRAVIVTPQPQPDNEEVTMLLMPMLYND